MSGRRITPERLAEIRANVDKPFEPVWRSDLRDLLAELDAVTRERNEARKDSAPLALRGAP